MNAVGYIGISQQMTGFRPLPCANLNPNERLKMRSPKGTCLWEKDREREAEEARRAKTLEKSDEG